MCTGGGTNTVTQKTQQPAWVQNAIQSQLTNALGTQGNFQYPNYTGELVPATNNVQGQAGQNYAGLSGFTPSMVTPGSVTAGNVTGYTNGIGAGPGGLALDQNTIARYQNPYTQQVIDTTMTNLNRQLAQTNQAANGQAAMSGAFGGDRAAIVNAENTRNANQIAAQTIANLQNQGFNTAAGLANTDINRGLTAGTTEAGMGLQAGQANLNAGLQAQQGNQFAGLQGANLNLAANNGLMGYGNLLQGTQQAADTNAYNQFMSRAYFPLQMSQAGTNTVQQLGGVMTSTPTTSTTSPGPSALSQIAGLGVAGAGLYGLFGGSGSSLTDSIGAKATGGRVGAARGGRIDGYADGGVAWPTGDFSYWGHDPVGFSGPTIDQQGNNVGLGGYAGPGAAEGNSSEAPQGPPGEAPLGPNGEPMGPGLAGLGYGMATGQTPSLGYGLASLGMLGLGLPGLAVSLFGNAINGLTGANGVGGLSAGIDAIGENNTGNTIGPIGDNGLSGAVGANNGLGNNSGPAANGVDATSDTNTNSGLSGNGNGGGGNSGSDNSGDSSGESNSDSSGEKAAGGRVPGYANGGEAVDYDYDAARRDGVGPTGDNGHWPDTYKLPNHPTFSDESKYNGQNGAEGGRWINHGNNLWEFQPGRTNIETHGLSGLQEYFRRVEPNAILQENLPAPNGTSGTGQYAFGGKVNRVPGYANGGNTMQNGLGMVQSAIGLYRLGQLASRFPGMASRFGDKMQGLFQNGTFETANKVAPGMDGLAGNASAAEKGIGMSAMPGTEMPGAGGAGLPGASAMPVPPIPPTADALGAASGDVAAPFSADAGLGGLGGALPTDASASLLDAPAAAVAGSAPEAAGAALPAGADVAGGLSSAAGLAGASTAAETAAAADAAATTAASLPEIGTALMALFALSSGGRVPGYAKGRTVDGQSDYGQSDDGDVPVDDVNISMTSDGAPDNTVRPITDLAPKDLQSYAQYYQNKNRPAFLRAFSNAPPASPYTQEQINNEMIRRQLVVDMRRQGVSNTIPADSPPWVAGYMGEAGDPVPSSASGAGASSDVNTGAWDQVSAPSGPAQPYISVTAPDQSQIGLGGMQQPGDATDPNANAMGTTAASSDANIPVNSAVSQGTTAPAGSVAARPGLPSRGPAFMPSASSAPPQSGPVGLGGMKQDVPADAADGSFHKGGDFLDRLYRGPNSWAMPVIAAGLGMMASRNPHALGAIGEGGLAGVKTAEQMAQQRATNDLRTLTAQANADYRRAMVPIQQQRANAYDTRVQGQNAVGQQNADTRRAGMEGANDARQQRMAILQQNADTLAKRANDARLSAQERLQAQRDLRAIQIAITNARLETQASMSNNAATSRENFGRISMGQRPVERPGVQASTVQMPTQGGGQQGAVGGPNAAAIQYLRDNPNMAAAFDAKYGRGAAAQVLGQ